jgi:hypothetical protein
MKINKPSARMAVLVLLVFVLALLLMLSGCSRDKERFLLHPALERSIRTAKEAPCEPATSAPPRTPSA